MSLEMQLNLTTSIFKGVLLKISCTKINCLRRNTFSITLLFFKWITSGLQMYWTA